jgi:hypothetical protein
MPLLTGRATRDYVVRMPRDTWVKAACEAVGCENWRYGWDSLIDERTPLGAQQAAYIRQHSGRTFREMKAPDGLTVFRFEPRQRCFSEHRTRPARLLVATRGQVIRRHTSFSGIAEDYTEHVGRLAEQYERG